MNREVHVRFWESPEVKVLRATRQKRPPRFVTGTAELASIADAGGHGTRFRVASTRGKAAGPQQAAVPGAGRGASYGPCVDGSGLARVFFTRAAVVGAAMCAVRLSNRHVAPGRDLIHAASATGFL